MDIDLKVRIGSRCLPNPVGTASGTFGYGEEYAGLYTPEKLGAVYTKAVSLLPREGNPPPRLVETASGILNAIGLANVGVEAFIAKKLDFLLSQPAAAVVNVAGSSPDEYIRVVRRLNETGIWGFEINLSCPNVRQGCLAFGTDPRNVKDLTALLRKETDKPLIIKLTPNVTDIGAIAEAAEEGGADAVSLINTLLGMAIDVKTARFKLTNRTGGLSGPAVKPVGVAAVYNVSRRVSIPVIGMGGIMSADDAVEYLLAGAKAIQIGTGNFVRPGVCDAVYDGIVAYMKEKQLRSIDDFAGLLKDAQKE